MKKVNTLIIGTIMTMNILNPNIVKAEQIQYKKEKVKAVMVQPRKKYVTRYELLSVHFNPFNITEPSKVSYEQLSQALKGTKMEELASYMVEAELLHGVNALFLTGLIATESEWNDSERANDNNNNIAGYAVYNNASRGRIFTSKRECVLETARLLKEDYLHNKGRSYNGVSAWQINIKYSESSNWADVINSIATNLMIKINKNI